MWACFYPACHLRNGAAFPPVSASTYVTALVPAGQEVRAASAVAGANYELERLGGSDNLADAELGF